jgi:hypothetical protein
MPLGDDAWVEVLAAYLARALATRADERPHHKPEKALESVYRWALDPAHVRQVRVLGHWRNSVHWSLPRMDASRREALLIAAFRRLRVEGRLLHSVLPTSQPDLVERLLSAGVPADETAPNGWTALHAAVGGKMASARSSHVFDQLVAAGASVGARDAAGWTALHLASARGQLGDTLDLLRLGANPTLRDDEGRLPADVVGTGLIPVMSNAQWFVEAQQQELTEVRAILEAAAYERNLPSTAVASARRL